ncbi:MAG: hypothetical protein HIU84_14175 [Acidobacteria bacterium]|nr:hypothetical protein [Acidobacteriota bacterium]
MKGLAIEVRNEEVKSRSARRIFTSRFVTRVAVTISAVASLLLAPMAAGAAGASILGPGTPVPGVIVGGGGGWYSDTVYGDCGTSTISAMPDGTPGGWKAFASLDSTMGTILFGEVTMTWGGSGGSGTFLFNAHGGANWTSTIVSGHVSPGATVGITLSGLITVSGSSSECEIGGPAVSFRTNS